VDWLKTLEIPIGIIACNDIRASQVLNAIRTCDFSVPDEIAIVGMDNDVCVCGLCDPSLSSVDLNAVHIGFLAAESLNTLLEGGSLDFQVQTVEPAGIIVRESSYLYAVEDEEVAHSLRFIAEKAPEGISVENVVAHASISRSTLERRFSATVGRSIKSEINRIRLLHLKELLSNTNYSLDKIARMVGFAHSEYMITFFKKAVGTTPGDYRKEHKVLSDQP
jgi:LacI family transcriptional regulator